MTQASTQIALGPGDGKTFGVVGQKFRILARGEQTGGAYAAFEAIVPPGDGAPPHLHVDDEEVFYVADGAITLNVDGHDIDAGTGSFVVVPKGVIHTFRNDGDRDARLLITVRPAGLDKFFQEVGIPISDPTGDPPPSTVQHMQKIIDTAPKYGMEIHMPTEA